MVQVLKVRQFVVDMVDTSLYSVEIIRRCTIAKHVQFKKYRNTTGISIVQNGNLFG